jgi:hypothetical protein
VRPKRAQQPEITHRFKNITLALTVCTENKIDARRKINIQFRIIPELMQMKMSRNSHATGTASLHLSRASA